MVQQKPTPEEQLLKLIEGQGAPASSAPEEAKIRTSRNSFNLFSGIGKISGVFEYWKSNFQRKNSPAYAIGLEAVLDIKWLNRALIVMVMMTLVYLVMDLAFFKPGRKDFFNHVSVSEPVFPGMQGVGAMAKESPFYLDAIKRRNPFMLPGSSTPDSINPEEGVTSAGTSNIINEMLQGYKLVGISWGDEPLAMLEETASGRTYFLKKGQEFKGIKVQEVGKERVKLTFEGKEAELF